MPYLSKKCLNELKDKKKLDVEKIINGPLVNKKKGDKYDVFLSYSYSDKNFALIICALLIECDISVYIDLNDDYLDRDDVGEETANRLAEIMNECRGLVYVHTPSAKMSKWCPWELGYMSGRSNFRCAVIPLIEDKEEFPYQEYLSIYPFVDYEEDTKTNKYTFWVNEYESDKYVSLKGFVNGAKLCNHE